VCPETCWPLPHKPPGPSGLPRNRADVVQVLVREVGPRALSEEILCWLDGDERERADKFVREADRRCFVEAHALLRWSLGLCLGVAPNAIAFARSSHGKPELIYPEPLGITFNLSHTDGLIALALAGANRRVGIDVERSGRATPTLQLARNFCPRETAYVATMPCDLQTDAFLRLWTRKEAAHKADGRGLSLPLDTIQVLGDRCGPWAISDLDLAPGYVGAVAWESRFEKLPVEIYRIE
jgi:4'-phosphopantetheinyl transferase